MKLKREEKTMPKNIGTHYPNDMRGTTDGNPTHVKPDDRGVTSGYPEHVANGARGLYGDWTKRSIDDGGAGVDPQKGVLNERPDWSWKYPKPVRT